MGPVQVALMGPSIAVNALDESMINAEAEAVAVATTIVGNDRVSHVDRCWLRTQPG